jgi:hypothetical protein
VTAWIVELLHSYLITIEGRLEAGQSIEESDELLDHTILSLYTWKCSSELIREAAIEQGNGGNLFEVYNGKLDPKKRKMLEAIADPDPVLNYHVAGLLDAAKKVREFAARFGITTPLNQLLKDYIFKRK